MNATIAVAILFGVAAAAVCGIAVWLHSLKSEAAKADNALDNEEIQEATDAATLRAATETDQQAVEDLRAGLRVVPPPRTRKS